MVHIPLEAIRVLAEEERRSGTRLMATPGEMKGAYERGFKDRGYDDADIKSTTQ